MDEQIQQSSPNIVPDAPSNKAIEEEEKSKKGLIIGVIVIILILVAFAGAFYYFFGMSNTATEEETISTPASIDQVTAPLTEDSNPVEVKQPVVKNNDDEKRNLDSDGDGISNYDEENIYGTHPNNPDTDGDGFSDGEEISNGYDPLINQSGSSLDCAEDDCFFIENVWF